MKTREKQIKRMIYQDGFVVTLFLMMTFVLSIFVLLQAMPLAAGSFRWLLVLVFALSTGSLGGSMIWVIYHLQKNREDVYGEELHYQELIRWEKEREHYEG